MSKKQFVTVTQSGLSRIPDAKVGDRFEVSKYTVGAGRDYQCAHVIDPRPKYNGQIWSLGQYDWLPVEPLDEALMVLKPTIIATLDLYRVGQEDESSVLPQAIWTTPDELRAIAFVIQEAQALRAKIAEMEEEVYNRGVERDLQS